MTSDNVLEQFKKEVPALGLLGTPHYIDPNTPYCVDGEVQLVCKYLKALQVEGIDKLYHDHECEEIVLCDYVLLAHSIYFLDSFSVM